MYVSVTERTFEIGLRKSIGAKYNDILWQFLSEAIIITLIGGIIGMIFGVLISWLISIIATAKGFSWNFVVSWPGIILAIGISITIGLIFGIYPVKKASLKSPIEALRYE